MRLRCASKIDAEVAEKLAAAGLPGHSPPPAAETPADEPAPPAPPAVPKRESRGPGLHFGSDDGPKTPFESWMEGRIKSKVGEDGTRGKLFLQTLLNNVPTMMLFCVPLFALVLKLLYVRKGRYYVEHLVYALHIHTFAYLGVTVIVLCALAIAQWSHTLRVLFSIACGFAMFVLVFLSIRRVYGEGWFFTTFKFLLGGIAYGVIVGRHGLHHAAPAGLVLFEHAIISSRVCFAARSFRAIPNRRARFVSPIAGSTTRARVASGFLRFQIEGHIGRFARVRH